MALNSAALDVAADALASALTYAQLHSGDPGGSGTSNVTSASRVAVSWTSDGGDLSLASPLEFTGGASNGAVAYVSLWSASTSGTFYGAFALSGDANFNSDGEYTVTAIDIDGSAS